MRQNYVAMDDGAPFDFLLNPIRVAGGVLGLLLTSVAGVLLKQKATLFAKSPTNGNIMPSRGVAEVLAAPPALLPAVLIGKDIPNPTCVFMYGEEIQGAVETCAFNGHRCEAGYVYGASVSTGDSVALITGSPGDVLKGRLVCWPSNKMQGAEFYAFLHKNDELQGYDPTHPEASAVRRGLVTVVLQEGSEEQAYWYFSSGARSGAGSAASSVVEYRALGTGPRKLSICAVVNGMWQMSGMHGKINPGKAVAAMFEYADAGLSSWDAADHYGPAELLLARFRQEAKKKGKTYETQEFTKWVPMPGEMSFEVVSQNVELALTRLEADTVDLMQFHWWDYSNKQYVQALKHLATLQEKGKIRLLGLTNFDTEHVKEIIEEHKIPIASNQVQFSLLDRRPLKAMTSLCKKHGCKLLAYGTLAGGMISKKYLGMSARQALNSFDTASLKKYSQVVVQFGGWDLFQELLSVLDVVSKRHGVSISNVADRWVLDQPAVGAVIIGARLGISSNVGDNLRIFAFNLTKEDHADINEVLKKANMPPGDCGDEYRDMRG
eukprot:g30712.t1